MVAVHSHLRPTDRVELSILDLFEPCFIIEVCSEGHSSNADPVSRHDLELNDEKKHAVFTRQRGRPRATRITSVADRLRKHSKYTNYHHTGHNRHKCPQPMIPIMRR
jgi:hypothetical protein